LDADGTRRSRENLRPAAGRRADTAIAGGDREVRAEAHTDEEGAGRACVEGKGVVAERSQASRAGNERRGAAYGVDAPVTAGEDGLQVGQSGADQTALSDARRVERRVGQCHVADRLL